LAESRQKAGIKRLEAGRNQAESRKKTESKQKAGKKQAEIRQKEGRKQANAIQGNLKQVEIRQEAIKSR
jgi:hypothetical protein